MSLPGSDHERSAAVFVRRLELGSSGQESVRDLPPARLDGTQQWSEGLGVGERHVSAGRQEEVDRFFTSVQAGSRQGWERDINLF